MTNMTAISIAHPNIAFIKYWGNRDDALRLPRNGSISMNLAALETRTSVSFDADLTADRFVLNGLEVEEAGFQRVSAFLDIVRGMAGSSLYAEVISSNSFPTGAGIASSASAFAALSLAASKAIGLNLDETALSRLARRGSGSACRSVPAGFTEWLSGNDDSDSYAQSIAPEDHWALVDCVAVIEAQHKPVGSTQGHRLASTSSLQEARLASVEERLICCRRAILECDFNALAEVSELDSTLMHAVMMTSQPPLFYWEPASLAIIKLVKTWRANGLSAFATLDAGANVHIICTAPAAAEVNMLLQAIPTVSKVLISPAGGGVELASS